MPSARRSRKPQQIDVASETDEEYNPPTSSQNRNCTRLTQSQNVSCSQSQLNPTQEPLSDEELNRLAALCVNFFLVANCKKVPIKRADIGKLIPREYSRRIHDVINAASLKLQKVFGYKIVELEKKNTFLLVNLLDLSAIFENQLPITEEPHERAIVNLRTCILATILMSGGTLHEATLGEFLKNFDLDINSKQVYPLLGNVQKLVYQDFVRQGYLSVKVVKDLDPHYREIQWGNRATAELNKKEVIKFVCKIYGDSFQPEMWEEQWKNAEEEEAVEE